MVDFKRYFFAFMSLFLTSTHIFSVTYKTDLRKGNKDTEEVDIARATALTNLGRKNLQNKEQKTVVIKLHEKRIRSKSL